MHSQCRTLTTSVIGNKNDYNNCRLYLTVIYNNYYTYIYECVTTYTLVLARVHNCFNYDHDSANISMNMIYTIMLYYI